MHNARIQAAVSNVISTRLAGEFITSQSPSGYPRAPCARNILFRNQCSSMTTINKSQHQEPIIISCLPVDTASSCPLMPLHIFHKVLYRTNLQPPPLPKPQTPIPPHHPALLPLSQPFHLLPILHQLTNHSRRLLPRESAELHRRLRMACALPYSTISRAQGEDVSWPAEGRRFRTRRSERPARQCPVVSGDAGRGGRFGGVDGDGVGGAVGVGIVDDHLGEVEGFSAR